MGCGYGPSFPPLQDLHPTRANCGSPEHIRKGKKNNKAAFLQFHNILVLELKHILKPNHTKDPSRKQNISTQNSDVWKKPSSSTDLGLTVDTSCKRNKVHCVAEAVNDYDGPGNILISWRHGKMRELVQALGYDDPPEYPEDRFDLIWTIPFPYDNITDIRSEDCPVLDVPEELAVDL
ncbi:hypothetical protein BDV35DRAFT_384741 [Aspergillus flavus]|uniref:Uncharacterized protein n=1 Tax=Aspergillus flavus TaxID=5059 RepID=A0A5N6GMH5_ASPFL|nr:hypothetical protein BDV35DRAFT_384741 [Aspergillus flavus]